MDKNIPIATWLLTLDETIISIGKGTPPSFPFEIEEIHLEGKAVLPGFIDAHGHLSRYSWQYANTLSCKEKMALGLSHEYIHWIDFSEIDTAAQVLSKLEKHVKRSSPGLWILGGGWKNLKTIPTRQELDRVTPANPVLLVDFTLHRALVNSYALKIAGIHIDSWDPRGGIIGRDAVGEPNGHIYEEAISFIEKFVPKIEDNVLKNIFPSMMKKMNSYGIVGVHDMESCAHYDAFPALSKLLREDQNAFTVRCLSTIKLDKLKDFCKNGLITGFGNRYLKVGPLKLIHDGALGSGTALMTRPYKQSSCKSWGTELLCRGEILHIARQACRQNISLAIHAIGDRAAENVAEIFELLKQENPNRKLHHRVEHIQSASYEVLRRFANIGVHFSIQPVHAPYDLPLVKKIQPELYNFTHAYRNMVSLAKSSKSTLAMGTDFPVAPIDPMINIYSAVTHKVEHALSIYEAVKFYTHGPAVLSQEENIKGTLTVGKLADFILVSEDILGDNFDKEKLLETKVLQTYMGAKRVY